MTGVKLGVSPINTMDLPQQITATDEVREKIRSWSPRDVRNPDASASKALREIVEFAVMVVILWLLLRAFEVEPFVIPTGSMAPTLMGRHMDVTCGECGFDYQTGASKENGNRRGGSARHEVTSTVCPICRYEMQLDRENDPNQRSFSGDRILVSKVAYQLAEPSRWDVAVFKFPGDPKINYIKRLVGLPGELLMIRHGDIYVKEPGGRYRIARKPPNKLVSMLQTVEDTNHVPRSLMRAGWPARWQPWPAAGQPHWNKSDDGLYSLDKEATQTRWLRYHHMVPDERDWEDALEGRKPDGADRRRGQLISDFYAYNNRTVGRFVNDDATSAMPHWNPGPHWVGDLVLEVQVQVNSESGVLSLDLVEGGTHFLCEIDLQTGIATLSMRRDPSLGGSPPVWDHELRGSANPRAETRLIGPGSYQLRFANCDDQLLLWINGHLVEFDVATTYTPMSEVQPESTEEDPLDLAPVGVGGKDASLQVSQMRVLRDNYYIASKYDIGYSEKQTDYDRELVGEKYRYLDLYDIVDIFRSPEVWGESKLFQSRRSVEFALGENEYFALGDNSPESKDARIWSNRVGGAYLPPPVVNRKFLTGKAFVIYWPHAWRRPIPFWPNFRRIRFIQ